MRPIDADALMEKCGGWYVEEGTESGFIGTLKNLLATEPTIQPEPHWIPVERELPEEPGYCITSNEYDGVIEDFYYDGHFRIAYKNAYKVIAWMPLPEAYKPNK